MNADELMKAVIRYGADAAGIRDRFGKNAELYALCFKDFLDGEHMPALAEAMRDKDYAAAFEAAHAIKGLSGNLGLTAYYAAICVLVESLRAKRYDTIEAEYAAVEREFEALRRVASGEAAEPCDAPAQVTTAQHVAAAIQDLQDKKQKEPDKLLLGAMCAILVVILIAFVSFTLMGDSYRSKTRQESGQHLLETGKQISMYVEEQIAIDWNIARSVARSVVRSNYTENDPAFVAILKDQQEAWQLTNLMLYTENGYCFNADGITDANGTASETIAHAHDHGSALSIIQSEITYTIPVETEQTYRGSRIVGVSVVRSLATLIDNFDLASFENEAWVYLTDENGVVISMLTTSNPIYTFNVNTIFAGRKLAALGDADLSAGVFSSTDAAFYLADEPDDKYVISMPIVTDGTKDIRMRLFYIVPEPAVNDASSRFSRQLTVFSLAVIAVLVGLASFAFLTMYRNRKRQFDADISAREQMFDLLIRNTRTVFGLFNTSKEKPSYLSANASGVLSDAYWSIVRTETGYTIRSASGGDTGMLRRANELLKEWDGRSTFRSGYLCNDATIPPTYFELILYPVDAPGNDVVGIILDVTAAHDREAATRNAMEMAKRSDKAKTHFLASMSHDIRTPMNAIMNMAEFALETAKEPRKHEEYLKTIYKSSEHLLRLINDVLDMSKIESGQTVISLEPFDIKAELLRQAEAVRPLCAAKHQTLLVDLDGITVEAVRGDALKVSQIVMNLLSNAVKFTPENGGVRLFATETPSLREDMVNVRVKVEDNGIGIAPEDREHVFEAFSRAHDRRIDSIEGTGLGLSICKSYVEAMGGTISCESEENEGSVFTVELFFEKASLAKPTEHNLNLQSNMPFLGMRCLVVDDIATNQTIAKTLLERVGFIVELANDGGEGANRFIRSKPGTYDVIYMDIQMPVMDGYQSAVRIRHSDHPQAKTIPIVAMSANVFAEDIGKARIAGMDGYVGKPVVSLELLEQTVKAFQTKKGITL